MFRITKGIKTGGLSTSLSWLAKAIVLPALALAFLCGGAQAAEEKETEKDTVKLEAVKVTANKMEEDPMDVPQSITVMGEVEMEEKGIQNIRDVIDNVPGMTYAKDHGTAINFRGLNSSIFTSNNPVAMFVDGIGYSGRTGYDTSLVNVERVEVLRGPSSTLYGKDAMGAVINVITKDPTNTWQGKVGAEYGSWNFYNGYFALNGPIVDDRLFLGFSGQTRGDDGWIKNDLPGMEKNANQKKDSHINGYVLMTPNESWRVRLSANHDYYKNDWMDEYNMGEGKNLDSFHAKDAKHVQYEVPTWTEVEDDSQSLRVEYTGKDVKVDSITTHRKQKVNAQYDADFGTDPRMDGLKMFDDNDQESWGQEIRLSSVATEGFRWTCGLYLDKEDRNYGPYGWEFRGNWPPPLGPVTPLQMDAQSKSEARTKAGFAQVMVPLSDDFELTLGARGQRIRKKIDLTTYYNPVAGPKMVAYQMHGDKTWDTFLPKAALTYDIDKNWTTYISYSKGYMPGGFNNFAMGGSVDDNSFNPSRSTTYELGLKSGYDDFSMGASVYYMDITDIHVYKFLGGGMMATDNAKKAHSQGVELEATYKPTDTLEFSGSFVLTEAKYDNYDAGGGVRFDGERIEMTPSHSLSLGVAYHAHNGFYARADGRNFGSRTFYDGAAKNFTKADPYTEIDGKVGYRFADFDVYAYCKNITDAGYVTTFRANPGDANNPGIAVAGVSEPRRFGVGVLYNF